MSRPTIPGTNLLVCGDEIGSDLKCTLQWLHGGLHVHELEDKRKYCPECYAYESHSHGCSVQDTTELIRWLGSLATTLDEAISNTSEDSYGRNIMMTTELAEELSRKCKEFVAHFDVLER